MAEFFDTHKKNLGEGWIKVQMGVNESKPANVANTDKTGVSKEFTAVNSNGPWICDAGKSGTGAPASQMGKIDSMAKQGPLIVNAAK